MFNLPPFTSFVIMAVPAFWVAYTLGFLWISRNWKHEDKEIQP